MAHQTPEEASDGAAAINQACTKPNPIPLSGRTKPSSGPFGAAMTPLQTRGAGPETLFTTPPANPKERVSCSSKEKSAIVSVESRLLTLWGDAERSIRKISAPAPPLRKSPETPPIKRSLPSLPSRESLPQAPSNMSSPVPPDKKLRLLLVSPAPSA